MADYPRNDGHGLRQRYRIGYDISSASDRRAPIASARLDQYRYTAPLKSFGSAENSVLNTEEVSINCGSKQRLQGFGEWFVDVVSLVLIGLDQVGGPRPYGLIVADNRLGVGEFHRIRATALDEHPLIDNQQITGNVPFVAIHVGAGLDVRTPTFFAG